MEKLWEDMGFDSFQDMRKYAWSYDYLTEEFEKLQELLIAINEAEINLIIEAEDNYSKDKDLDKLIKFYEGLWKTLGSIITVNNYFIRLADLYLKKKENDKAWAFLNDLIINYLPHESILEQPDIAKQIRQKQIKILKKEGKDTSRYEKIMADEQEILNKRKYDHSLPLFS